MPRLSRLLLAAALALACLPAKAQEGDPAFQCVTVERGLADARARGISVQVLVGDAAQRFVAIVNAEAPATNYKAEKVAVLMFEGVAGIAFVTGNVACAFRTPFPAEVVKSWVKTATGADTI